MKMKVVLRCWIRRIVEFLLNRIRFLVIMAEGLALGCFYRFWLFLPLQAKLYLGHFYFKYIFGKLGREVI